MLLSAAASGLARIHEIGAETGLHDKVVKLGAADTWLQDLIDTPNRIGEALGAPAPRVQVPKDAATLDPNAPRGSYLNLVV